MVQSSLPVLSGGNAAPDRLEKRLSESIDPEVKEKINRHLAQTREQQDRLKLTIRAHGRLPVPEPTTSLKGMIERGGTPNEREVWE